MLPSGIEHQLARRPSEAPEDDNPEGILLLNEPNEEEDEEVPQERRPPFSRDLDYSAVPSDEGSEPKASRQFFPQETVNVIQLGLGMCLLYSAVLTQCFTVQPVFASRHEEDPRFSEYAGYYSTTLCYIVYTFANLFAAAIVKRLGTKWSLVISSLGNALYMAGFLFLNPFFLYFSAFIQGICTAVIGTALGLVLSQNSTEKTISRNSGILWMLFMISMIIGGIFLLVMFSSNDEQKISLELTRQIHLGYTGFCILACIPFAMMKPALHTVVENTNTWKEIKKSVRLMTSKDMTLLFPLFIFAGMEAGIYSGVYSTALVSTTAFHMNTNVLIAWNSIAVGAGQITAGLSLTILGERANRRGVFPLILVACFAGCTAFALVFINIPGNATYEKTDDIAFIHPSVAVALLAGYLMGVCDCLTNSGIYSFITVRYDQESAEANAVMKFVSSLPTIASIYAGSLLKLYWQLLISSVAGVLAFIAFVVAERRAKTFKAVGL